MFIKDHFGYLPVLLADPYFHKSMQHKHPSLPPAWIPHAHVLIWQPKHHLPVARCQHVEAWIPLAHGDTATAWQRRHRPQHFALALFRDCALCIPHHRVVLRARAADQVAPVRAEAYVALAKRAERRAWRGPGGEEGGLGGRKGAVGLQMAFESV